MLLYVHEAPAAAGALTGVLLLAALLALVAAGHELALRLDPEAALRLAALIGSCLFASIEALLSEVLSPFHGFARGPLDAGWALVAIAAAAVALVLRRRRVARAAGAPEGEAAKGYVTGPADRLLAALMAAAAGLQAIWIAVTAYTYAPNNYDVLTYQLPRALHWLQERSAGPFATNTDRQVQFPPLSELGLAHLHLVAADDSLANFQQWLAMLLAALAVMEIARRLGVSRPGQAGAALLGLALPIGIGEAATSQNGYVVTAWLAVFTAFGLAYAAQPGNRWWALLTGLALGLSLLTKSTAYVFAAPLVLLIAGRALATRGDWRALAPAAALAAAATLLINAGQYLVTYRTWRSPLGPTNGVPNDVVTPAALAANLLRNIALEVPLPGALEPAGRALQGVLAGLYSLTGFAVDDPRVTIPGSGNVFHQAFWYGPDFAGNLVQTILIGACLVWLAWSRAEPLAKWLALALALAFLLFCGYLKFQIWGNRLLLPLLVLWSPVIVAVLLDRRPRLAALLPLAVLLLSFAWVPNSADSPPPGSAGLTRTQYYASQASQPEFEVYRVLAAAAQDSGCHSVGLSYANGNIAEYPLWAIFEEAGWQVRIEHVDVANPTARWADRSFRPCAVMADRVLPSWATAASSSRDFGGYHLYLGVASSS